MRNIVKTLFYFIIFSALIYGSGEQQYSDLKDFTLETGKIIKNCKLGYRTYGKLNEGKTNAVIFPTWFGGTSQNIGSFMGSGKLADSARYFVIAIDAFGNGISSSPANSAEQDNESFPVFSIADMVKAEHKLVTEDLGIRHLYAAIGGSMGSMQVYQWLVTYPDFITKAVTYVPTPRVSSYELMNWNIMLTMIENGHKCGMQEKDIMKPVNMLNILHSETPRAFVNEHPYESFQEYLGTYNQERKTIFTSYNFASQLRAMLSFNISKKFDNSLEKAALEIKAKVLVIVSLQDHTIEPKQALDFAKLIHAKVVTLNSELGHLAIGHELPVCSKAIAEFLDEQ